MVTQPPTKIESANNQRKSVYIHMPEAEANLLQREAQKRGFRSPSDYVRSLLKKDLESSALNADSHKVPEKEESPQELRARLTQMAGEIKTNDLGNGKYEALINVRDLIRYGDEKKHPFLKELDPHLRDYREKLRSGNEPPLTEVILAKICEAIFDYVVDKRGTLPLPSGRLVLITQKDVERFQMLGKIGLFDLEEVNSKVLAERKKDYCVERDLKVGADDKPGDENDQTELAPNESGDDLVDEDTYEEE